MRYNGSKILVIDDNPEILTTFEVLLSDYFEQIVTEANPERLVSLLQKEQFHVIILDMNFKAGQNTGNEGLYWLDKIKSIDPDVTIVMITAYGSVDLAVEAIKSGATDFIAKPWRNEKLITTIVNAYQLHKGKQDLKDLKNKQELLSEDVQSSFPPIIGESYIIKNILKKIKKVAATDANILLLGESGTGKELFAREIHRQSKRNRNVFVDLDVASLPESIIESEMFGYEKGAFTDAKTHKAGRFEIAHGGTLFLDEIGNLSLAVQAKLLSVLQNREFIRLGATKKVKIDVRVITATNMPIYDLVNENQFREDLLYRINTIQIQIPALRERKTDIPLIANYYLDKFKKKYEIEELAFTRDSMNKLIDYEWPGNIRELVNIVEKCVILSEDEYISSEVINFNYIGATKNKKDVGVNLKRNEIILIKRAIENYNGNYSEAAKALGISRKTLYNKMNKYSI